MNLKVMFYANGIGPLNKNANKKMTCKILNQVDVITLREELSLHELKTLHINKPKIIITADPALTIGAVTGSEIDHLLVNEGIDTQGPFVGFSVRKWQGSERYEEIIAYTADYMIEKYKVKPLFVPMHYPDDLSIIESVVSKMKGKGYVIRNKYSVLQTIGIISRMEILIGMRLHALIFAASLGIPIIGLVYEPKIKGFLEYVNQASAGDVRYLELEKLKLLVDDVWKNRHELKQQLKKDVAVLKERALDNAKIAVELTLSEES